MNMNSDAESDRADSVAGDAAAPVNECRTNSTSAVAASVPSANREAKPKVSHAGRWLMVGMCALQMAGILTATILAIAGIRTIVLSGPLLASTGLVLAGISYAKNRPVGLYFGLGTPSVAVLCFAIIFGLQWSPDDAQVPISILLVICAAALIPAGGFAIRELRREKVEGKGNGRFQFSIKDLFVLTTLVAVVCRLAFFTTNVGLASALVVAYAALVLFVLRQFHRCR